MTAVRHWIPIQPAISECFYRRSSDFKDTGLLNKDDLLSVYQQTLIKEGVLTLGINNFCLEHTKQDIDRHFKAIDLALDHVKRAVKQDSTEGILQGSKIIPIFKRN